MAYKIPHGFWRGLLHGGPAVIGPAGYDNKVVYVQGEDGETLHLVHATGDSYNHTMPHEYYHADDKSPYLSQMRSDGTLAQRPNRFIKDKPNHWVDIRDGYDYDEGDQIIAYDKDGRRRYCKCLEDNYHVSRLSHGKRRHNKDRWVGVRDLND